MWIHDPDWFPSQCPLTTWEIFMSSHSQNFYASREHVCTHDPGDCPSMAVSPGAPAAACPLFPHQQTTARHVHHGHRLHCMVIVAQLAGDEDVADALASKPTPLPIFSMADTTIPRHTTANHQQPNRLSRGGRAKKGPGRNPPHSSHRSGGGCRLPIADCLGCHEPWAWELVCCLLLCHM